MSARSYAKSLVAWAKRRQQETGRRFACVRCGTSAEDLVEHHGQFHCEGCLQVVITSNPTPIVVNYVKSGPS